MNLREKRILFFATGAYAGKAKVAPGTFGTLVGIPLYFILSFLNTPTLLPYLCLVTIALIIFAIWIADQAVTILQVEDPGCVVIDEIAGFVVTMIGIGFTLQSVIFAFLLFRFFDILKPFPVKYLEENIPGGAGVVLDDVAAGIMANICLRMLLAVFG
ncbi:MAG: phosphatidylglycerophosphatase A [Proteobacteria bacterium]|nr:phosphatidylglycerophosphatase A [Pseudomonadota bacterium]